MTVFACLYDGSRWGTNGISHITFIKAHSFFGNTIHKIARTGEETRFVSEGLNGPVGIAVGEDDTLYVCNCSGNFIARVTPAGEVSRLAEGDLFACPNGIVFGPDEQLYVTNFNNHDIIQISTEGAASKFALVPGGAGNAHITYAKGFFFVTKVFANTVSKIDLDGEVFQVAGTGQAGHTDGPADTATLAHPNGITVSPTGDMLFVNTLIGDFRSSGPTQMTIRTVEFTTMTKVLDAAQAEGGIEEMAVAYKAYSEDPIRSREDTVAEMITYGYRHLSGGQTPEALEIFRLNAEAHPDDPGALFQFGEFYRYTGQNEAAVEQYHRTLEIDPEHSQASARLAQLGADQD